MRTITEHIVVDGFQKASHYIFHRSKRGLRRGTFRRPLYNKKEDIATISNAITSAVNVNANAKCYGMKSYQGVFVGEMVEVLSSNVQSFF